jgi:hypothetical protein
MANTPNPDSPTGAVTLWVNGRDARDGAATLTPITDTTSGHTVHLVTVDRRAAECYGIRQPDGVIGGLVRMRGRWSPTAYRDRSHLFTYQGPTYFLPYARSRACAVRGLLRWWWTVERRTRDGANPGQLDPFQESAKFRRWLMV